MTSAINNNYTEDALVKQPAIAIFDELDWETVDCFYEKFGENGTLGRETTSNVVLIPLLHSALMWQNPAHSKKVIDLAIEELTWDKSTTGPAKTNSKIFHLLKNGIRVAFQDEDNEKKIEIVKVINWNKASNNDFLYTSHFFESSEMYNHQIYPLLPKLISV